MKSVGPSVEEFLQFCRAKGLSPKTVGFSYAYPLRSVLVPFCEKEGKSDVDQLQPELIQQLAAELNSRHTAKGQPLAKATVRAYLKSIQQYLSWLERERKVAGVHSKAVPLPTFRKNHREVLSRQEIQRLEDAAPTERNKLLIRLMGDTGAREGEVASIRLDDLVQRDRMTFVRLRGKTGERLPPITAALHRRLKAYSEGKTGRPRTKSQSLFMAARRRPGGDYEPLTEDGVYQAVKDAVARTELGRRIYPHLFRHSAITWMVAEGMHPALISDVTGVSVAVIASHYSHPSDEQRYRAVMKAMGEI